MEHNGKKASRDIVQFVALKDMERQTPESIAKSLLEEIPGQVSEYMINKNITIETLQGIHY